MSVVQVQSFIDQAFLISTQGINGTDTEWGACLACAVVDRARARMGVQPEGICAACLQRYCWNGQEAAVSGGGSGGGSGSGTGSSKNGGVRVSGSVSAMMLIALVVAYVV